MSRPLPLIPSRDERPIFGGGVVGSPPGRGLAARGWRETDDTDPCE